MVLVILASCRRSWKPRPAFARRARGADRGGAPPARRRRLLIGGAVAGALLLAGLGPGWSSCSGAARHGSAERLPPRPGARAGQAPAVREPARPRDDDRRLQRCRQTGADDAGAVVERELRPHAHRVPPGRSDRRRLGRAAVPRVRPARFCTPPWPYIPYQQLPSDAQRPKSEFRRVGTGSFRGRRVFWVEQLYQPPGSKPSLGGNQVAYDAVTHQPVALRTIERGGRFKGRTSGTTRSRSCRTSPGGTSHSSCRTAEPTATRRALRPSSRATGFLRLGSARQDAALARPLFPGAPTPLGRGRPRWGSDPEAPRAAAAAGALRKF